eukprot:SAG31_NODE_9599_length_1252_cov_11.466321_1_plen_282_part_01
MLCGWESRQPWARYTTKDPSLLTGWKLADKNFATDASGAAAGALQNAGPLFHLIPYSDGKLYMITLDDGRSFAIGSYDAKTEKMNLTSDASGKAVREVIDYGDVYHWAAMGLAADGRLLTIAWVDEAECAAPPTTPGHCGGMSHRSVLSLPRELLWDSAVSQLISRPVAELKMLRNASFLTDRLYTVPATGGMVTLAEISVAAGGSLDLEVSFLVPMVTAPQQFGVAVRAAHDSSAVAAVQLVFNVSAANVDGSRLVGVADAAKQRHGYPGPRPVARWMNDT